MPTPKKITAFPAKLTRPQTVRALTRTRLYRHLDGLDPAVWVVGPPGAGKTTLVSKMNLLLRDMKRSGACSC